MPNVETYRALLAKVEEAKGGSEELDSRIWQALQPNRRVMLDPGVAFGTGEKRDAIFDKLSEFPMNGWGDYKAIAASIEAPPLTTSIDAALALVESQLPAIKAFAAGSPPSSGWKLNFYRGMTPTGAPYALWQANIRQHASDGFEGDGSTLPLAIMAAFLKAKLALLQQSETAHVER